MEFRLGRFLIGLLSNRQSFATKNSHYGTDQAAFGSAGSFVSIESSFRSTNALADLGHDLMG
jgi:hypothetical protein